MHKNTLNNCNKCKNIFCSAAGINSDKKMNPLKVRIDAYGRCLDFTEKYKAVCKICSKDLNIGEEKSRSTNETIGFEFTCGECGISIRVGSTDIINALLLYSQIVGRPND